MSSPFATSFTRTRLEIRMISLAAALGHASLDDWTVAEHVLRKIGIPPQTYPVTTVAELFAKLRTSWRKAAATEDSRQEWLSSLEEILLHCPSHCIDYVSCVDRQAMSLHERLALLRRAYDATQTESDRIRLSNAMERVLDGSREVRA